MNFLQSKYQIVETSPSNFQEKALALFQYQYERNAVYQTYANLLHRTPDSITNLHQIPFIPVSFFKTHRFLSEPFHDGMLYFESSTTTNQTPSKHYIFDPGLYECSFMTAFEHFFGTVSDYCIVGLLPSYLERGHSSLVYMVEALIQQSKHPLSGFYLNNYTDLYQVLQQLESQKQKTLVFGVTYALLDFAENFPIPLNFTRIIETGGMKGRRIELTRTEVHNQLKSAFALDQIYSEYGMTELLSQAYSLQNEVFEAPPWMRLFVRELNDPAAIASEGKGAINIIDLANRHSCAFLSTDDYGEVFANGTFKIHGRIDHSEIRGCSLLTIND